MDKDIYIEQERLKLLQYWASLVFGPGVFIIISLTALDYFATPENFPKFLIIRLISAALIVPLFFLNRLRVSKFYQLGLITLGALVVSAMVELMILSFGGHQSSYYVGMIIIYMFSLGFLPFFSVRITLFFASLTYCIYLFPILAFDHITNMRVFVTSNIFLISIIITSI